MKIELSDFLKPVIGIFDADDRARMEQRIEREMLEEGDITFGEFVSGCVGSGAYIAALTAYNIGLFAGAYGAIRYLFK